MRGRLADARVKLRGRMGQAARQPAGQADGWLRYTQHMASIWLASQTDWVAGRLTGRRAGWTVSRVRLDQMAILASGIQQTEKRGEVVMFNYNGSSKKALTSRD